MRIRTLAKFVEGDYAKIGRLVQVRGDYATRLGKVEKEIEEQRKGMETDEAEEMKEEWLSRRLDAGLFGIQMTDLILAWLCAEDGGARTKIAAMLESKKVGMESVRNTLKGRGTRFLWRWLTVADLRVCRIDRLDGGGRP